MAKTKVLILVKTYPALSNKYGELVCTAGIREDGSWIRIYPIPFRKLDFDQRYRKWQWVEMDLVKNESDPRKESHRPYNIDDEIVMGEFIDTHNLWEARKSLALHNVKFDMDELIKEARNEGTSLAILKPKEIIDFIYEPDKREWDPKKLQSIINQQRQGSLFEQNDAEKIFKIVDKLPYKFSYVFTTEDGKTRTVMIEDWEVGALYWNCLKKTQDEKRACEMVRQKYFEKLAKKCDLYFIMGTTKKWHYVGLNPFLIIGLIYPPKEPSAKQLEFDFGE